MATNDEKAIEPAGERYAADPSWRKDVLAMLAGMKAEGLLPKGMTEQTAFLLITRGRELGMQPMESLEGLFVVNGRVSMEGETMLSLVNRNNLGTYEVLEATARKARALFVNRTGSRFEASFDWDDAERAKLTNKDTYKQWPKAMLLWRAVAWGVRVVFPEAFNGIYTRDEAESMEPVSVAYTVTEAAPEPPVRRYIPAAELLEMKAEANVPAEVFADTIAGMGFPPELVPEKLAPVLSEKLRLAGERLRAEAAAAEAAEQEPPQDEAEPENPLADEEATPDPYHAALERKRDEDLADAAANGRLV